MAKHDFATLKPKIVDAINERIKKPGFPIDPQGYSLVDGFVMVPLQESLGDDVGYVIGGDSLPMIAIVGNSSARVFYFAAVTLLPGVKFK